MFRDRWKLILTLARSSDEDLVETLYPDYYSPQLQPIMKTMKRSKMVNDDEAKIYLKQDAGFILRTHNIIYFRVGQGGDVNIELTAMTSISEILTLSYNVPCVAPECLKTMKSSWYLSLRSLPGH